MLRFDRQRSAWPLLRHEDSAAAAIANYPTRDVALAGIDRVGRWLEDVGLIVRFVADDEAAGVIDEHGLGDQVRVAESACASDRLCTVPSLARCGYNPAGSRERAFWQTAVRPAPAAHWSVR